MAEARATRPIEWVIAVVGGLALSAVLVWILRGSEPASGPSAPAMQPGTGTSTSSAAQMTSPPSAATTSAPIAASPAAPLPPAPMAAPVEPGGLKLRGLMVRQDGTGSAIIETADGRQRLMRPGSLVGPGMKVERIDAAGVTLVSGGTQQLLRLGDGAITPRIEAQLSGERPSARPRDLVATSNDYRLALKPRRTGKRITGFTVTDVSRLPALQLAGLRPGDVVISINGTGIESEEKLIEMPQEIAGAFAVDVVFERGGERQRTILDIKR